MFRDIGFKRLQRRDEGRFVGVPSRCLFAPSECRGLNN